MSDTKEKLNDGIIILQIKEVESICGKLLPDSFVKLYEAANGENTHIGVILGFDWLGFEEVITAHKALTESDYKIMSDKQDKIKEGAYKKGWIPFAHDGSGSYLVMDLDPISLFGAISEEHAESTIKIIEQYCD
jgi:SMI1 / KNR4 family.